MSFFWSKSYCYLDFLAKRSLFVYRIVVCNKIVTATTIGSVYLMKNTDAIKEEQPKTDLT